MDVELPHFGPCLFPVSLENDCFCFVDDFDVSVGENHCASCVAEFTHAEKIVGERWHDVTILASRW